MKEWTFVAFGKMLRCGCELWQQSMMFETRINGLEWVGFFSEKRGLMRVITDAKTQPFKQRQFVLSYSGENTDLKYILFKEKQSLGSGREKDISLLVCDHNYTIYERKSEELRKS